jgi:hypothetical protein
MRRWFIYGRRISECIAIMPIKRASTILPNTVIMQSRLI